MFSVLITPIHFDFGKGGQDVLEKTLIPKAFGVVHKTPAALRKKPASTVSQWMPVGGVGGIRTVVVYRKYVGMSTLQKVVSIFVSVYCSGWPKKEQDKAVASPHFTPVPQSGPGRPYANILG